MGGISADNTQLGNYEQSNIIVFIFGSFLLGAIFRIVLKKWAVYIDKWEWDSFLKFPYSVFLMLLGMLATVIGNEVPAFNNFLINYIEPHLFMTVFLPVVLFESAYVIDFHIFVRSIGHILLLAVPGLLIISAVLTGWLTTYMPELDCVHDQSVKWNIGLTYGAIISATDPVAVVAPLKDIGSQKYLGTIIEGEALVNDGAAIVLYNMFFAILTAATSDHSGTVDYASLIMLPMFCGVAIGLTCAFLASFVLRHIYNDALAEITVALSVTYLTFFIGEKVSIGDVHSSGVLAVVVYGLFLDKSAITYHVDIFMHGFLDMLAYLANTFIFVFVGILIVGSIDKTTATDWGWLALLYFATTVIRGVSISLFYPVMRNLKVDINWKPIRISQSQLHMVKSSSTSKDKNLKDLTEEVRLRYIKGLKTSYGKQYKNGALSDPEKRVLINAADTAYDTPPWKYIAVAQIRKYWTVKGMYPYLKKHLEHFMYATHKTKLMPPGTRRRRRVYRLVQKDWFEFVMQFVIVLNIVPIIVDFELVEKVLVPVAESFNETVLNSTEAWAVPLKAEAEVAEQNLKGAITALFIVNCFFFIVYSLEIGLELYGLGAKQFWQSHLNKVDCFFLLLTFIHILVEAVIMGIDESSGGTGGVGSIMKTTKMTKSLKFLKMTKPLRFLRGARLFRLSKSILPRMVKFINHQIHKQLRFGYNVRKRFITAEEEVCKLLISICDNEGVTEKLTEENDINRRTVTKKMGWLQRDHLCSAISFKSRNAVRTVLNSFLPRLCGFAVISHHL